MGLSRCSIKVKVRVRARARARPGEKSAGRLKCAALWLGLGFRLYLGSGRDIGGYFSVESRSPAGNRLGAVTRPRG